MLIGIYLETLPWCVIPSPEKLYVNLSHNYFKPDINRCPSQDQGLLQLQYDTLKFCMLSIALEMNVGFRFYLVD
jgi:hypothetical protein